MLANREQKAFRTAHFLSSTGIRLDNFGANSLKWLEHKMRMVGPGGLEPPTKRL
jgi:hypothetical protein